MNMKNKLTKIQTETTYEVEFEGNLYTVVHTEDSELMQDWLIQSDPLDDEDDGGIAMFDEVPEELELKIIEFVINEM
jgi:hypothetical protein